MRIAYIVATSLALSLPGLVSNNAQAQAPTMGQVTQAQLVQWRRDFHTNPELGNREVRTAEVVAAHLRKLGLKVETGIAHTGVVALLEGGAGAGPRLALRADMDALPVTEETGLPFASTVRTEFRGEQVGVMHACGHDGHMAILMGVAQALAGMREQLKGSVLFIFQPAEEGAPEGEKGGAELMLAEGLFDRYKPDAVVGLHLLSNFSAGTAAVRAGPLMAEADRFTILVEGQQTHGSRPWNGIDPILTAARIVDGMQSIVSRRIDLTRSPAVVSVGSIKGGIRYNIIPDRVEMVGTIRSFEDDVREGIYADLRQIAEHTAAAHGATATLEIERPTIVTVNDPELTQRLRPSLERALGKQNVLDTPPSTVAEDFAYFAKAVPGFYFFVGSTPADQDPNKVPTNHSPRFDLDESALMIGQRAMLQVSLDFLGTHATEQ